jgi:uncharacterized membrane protein
LPGGGLVAAQQKAFTDEQHWRMDGRMGGGMWIWTVIGVAVVVLLVVAVTKLSKR